MSSRGHIRAAALLAVVLLAGLDAAPAQAAPELELGRARASRGATARLPLQYTGDGTVTALQVDLGFDAVRLGAGVPEGGAALADHRISSGAPADGTLRLVAWSPSNAVLASASLAEIPFQVAADAALGDTALSLGAATLATGAAGSVAATRLAGGTLSVIAALQPGQPLVVDSSVSDGSPDRTAVLFSGLAAAVLRFRLSGASQGGCTVRLAVLEPDGSQNGPVLLTASVQSLQLTGGDGNWTFLVYGSGGCSGQGFHLEAQPVSNLVGIERPGVLLGALLVCSVLLLRGRYRRQTEPTERACASLDLCQPGAS